MPPKYLIVPMKFDTAKWAHLMRRIQRDEMDLFAAAMAVQPETIKTWRNLERRHTFPFPSMSTFIAACNALDVDPRDFFCLNLPEHDHDGK